MVDGAPFEYDLKWAEGFFKSMGCSGFHMCREYPTEYERYRALGISKELERRWRVEEFRALEASMEEGSPDAPEELRSAHSRMADLIREISEEGTAGSLLRSLLGVTRSIRPRLPDGDEIKVVETILGRSDRDDRAPMPRALKLGMADEAKAFGSLARELLGDAGGDEENERMQSAHRRLAELEQRRRHSE